MSEQDPPPPGPPPGPPPEKPPRPPGPPGDGDRFTAFIASERRLLWTARGLLVAILAVILIFLSLTWSGVKANFTAERFGPPIEEAMAELGPPLTDALGKALLAAKDPYIEHARERWKTVQPELMQRADAEIEKFRDQLARRMERDAKEMLDRVIRGKESRLKKDLPHFADDEREREFRDRLAEDLFVTTDQIASKAYAANREHIDEMLVSIDQFETDENPYEAMDIAQLGRHYLHLWLELLDHHILYSDVERG